MIHMSFVKSIKQKILDSSDTFSQYKKENVILKNDLNKEIMACKNEIKSLKKRQLESEEILNSNYSFFNTLWIDYDLKPKGILKNMQGLCQEVLDFFVNVCEKNELNYWLIGGNLLGAVRHGGYIPWDDDMDVGMMRKEFHAFNDCAFDEIKSNNLENYLTLKVFEQNPIYTENINPFTKLDCIAPNNIILAGLVMFPYDYANDKKFTLEEFCEFKMGFISKSSDYEETLQNYYSKFRLVFDDGKYVIPNPTFLRYADRYKKDLIFYERERIFPFKTIKFNGKDYNCPNDVEYFLKPEYGDYMNIPKILRDQHKNVDSLRNIEGINDYYREYINKLKECNDNFKF